MRFRTLLLGSLLAAVCSPTRAQNLVEQQAPETPGALNAVRVQQPIKPAFLITPLVHRMVARRGQLLSFEYEIESNLKPTRLEISMVGMKQQENGVILPDSAAAQPSVLQLLSPASIDLLKGEKQTIRCQLRVPTENTPFLTYGVLVKEVPIGDGNGPDNQNQPSVGIRFMTQYLLRTDIEVIGVRAESVKQLELVSGRLEERNGAAMINVMINNPTPTAMEFQVRTQLVSQANSRSYASNLYVPVRVNQQEPERYDARILGNTLLRLEGVLADSVFPGEYALKVELLYKGRVYQRTEFPVTISAGDFPAQDATIVRVASDISVEPSSVELSLQKGGSRMQAFTIENGSQQKIVASLSPKQYIGELADWISFRPDVVELAPGQKRKVLVTLGSKRDFTEHSYAFATIKVSPEVGEAIGTQDIPIALLVNSESLPDMKPGDLSWRSVPAPAGFEIPIHNSGLRHMELQARLTLKDQFGRGFVVEDGYGRWVLPGRADKLRFMFREPPPPGTYQVKLEIQQGLGLPTMEMNQTIQLKEALEERVSQGSEDSPIR